MSEFYFIIKNNNEHIRELNGWESLQSWEDSIDSIELMSDRQKFIYALKNSDIEKIESDKFQLVNLKQSKIKELNPKMIDARANYKGSIIHNGIEWDSGEVYEENIRKTLNEANKNRIVFPIAWRDKNNEFHDISKVDLEEILSKIESNRFDVGQSLYFQKWQMETEIMGASTLAQINAIEIVYNA